MRRGPRNGDRSVVGIRVAAAVLAGKRDERKNVVARTTTWIGLHEGFSVIERTAVAMGCLSLQSKFYTRNVDCTQLWFTEVAYKQDSYHRVRQMLDIPLQHAGY